MGMSERTINRLPAITWYWLKMNETTISTTESGVPITPEVSVPDTIRAERVQTDPLAAQPTGAGGEASAWIDEEAEDVLLYTAEQGVVEESPVILRFGASGETKSASAVSLQVAEQASMIVVMDIRSAEEASGAAALRTRFHVGKGGRLALFQILRPGSQLALMNDIGGTCEEDGCVEIRHLFLTTGKTCQGCRVDLPGEGASMQTEIAYLVEKEGDLDMNYIVEHTGKKTNCDIQVSGVLRDHAKKIFRGTIDFVRGASGATGTEIENVLMMDDTVRNQTIPLILCAEEDVEGNHGATIGRLDEELLFYLESRGMTPEEIYEMVARARVDALVQQIPDAEIRASIGETHE